MVLKLAIKPVLTFKTSKGSQYWADKKGRCQRNKSYHPEHGVEDQGLKYLFDKVIFVNNSDANQLVYAIAYRGTWWMVIRRNMVEVVSLGKDKKLYLVSGPFHFSNKPRLGLAPIEMNVKYDETIRGYYIARKCHIGNKIVELEYLE